MEKQLEDSLVDRFTLAGFVESCRLLEEGIASMKDIDLGLRAGAGYSQGPFAWADGVGLDVILEKLETLEKEFGPRFKPPAMLRDLIARGNLGQKTGRGFYEYGGAA